jgi:UDP-GlcNAc:undecaprenyl-phosphate GlcNAc-1-phosphate transferase
VTAVLSVAATAAAAGVALVANRWAVRQAAATPGSRWVRTNHAGDPVTLAEGPVATAALLAGVGLGAATGQPLRRSVAVTVAGAGAGAVGAYDDLFGSSASRGFRGHLRALRSGTVTSGLVKIVGVGVAAAVASTIIRGAGSSAHARKFVGGCAAQARTSRRSPRSRYDPVSLPRRPGLSTRSVALRRHART